MKGSCDKPILHEIFNEFEQPHENFQSEADKYIAEAASIINPDGDLEVDEEIAKTLRLGIDLINQCIYSMRELDFYRMKYTKVPPEDVELSKIKKCHIGRCKCGQLLLESRDKCCPKCNQFILWPPMPKSQRCK